MDGFPYFSGSLDKSIAYGLSSSSDKSNLAKDTSDRPTL